KPPALTSSWIISTDSVTAGLDHASGSPARMASNTSDPPRRSTRYERYGSSGHLLAPASAIGATPALSNTGTRASRSSQVAGGSAPTLSKTSLLYSTTTGWMLLIAAP